MKKYIVIMLTILFSISFAAPRKVLGEMFTSTTCGPCRQGNIYVDGVVATHWETLSMIRYHVWWPSEGDPFYDSNPSQNRSRVQYYHINAVPSVVVDGEKLDGYNFITVKYDERMDTPSPIYFYLYINYDRETREGTALFHIVPDTEMALMNQWEPITGYLHLVLVEDSIQYNAPNGLTMHHQTMKEMFPNAGGKYLVLGSEYVEERPFNIDTAWIDTLNVPNVIPCNDEMCQLVGFFQEMALPHEVHNSDHYYVIPKTGEYDFEITEISQISSGNWRTIEPGDTVYIYAEVKNNGDDLEDAELILKTEPEYEYVKRSIDVGEIKKGKTYKNEEPLIIYIPEDETVDSLSITVYLGDRNSHQFVSSTVDAREHLGIKFVNRVTPIKVQSSDRMLTISGYSGKVLIYDALGREIKHADIRGEGTVDLRGVSPGIYLIRFSKTNKTEKIIIF